MSEHGTICPLCDETLHEGELCDQPNCPLGGSVTVMRRSKPITGVIGDAKVKSALMGYPLDDSY